jgi:MscS family membrane protein
MGNFLDRVYFDNTLRSYITALAVILFILLINRIISKYFAALLFSFVRRVWKDLDKKTFISLLVHPLGVFVTLLVSIIALHRLHFPEVLNVEVYRYTTKDIVHAIATIILIGSLIWLVLRMIDFITGLLQQRANFATHQSDNQLIIFFRDFFKVVVGIAGVLLILHFAFNFHIGNLLTGLSIVGAAIALSLRESLENLIASFVIFFDKPFATGDTVKVQGVTGTVEKIGLRSTRVRTDQKTYVTVPNKQMVDSILDNLSLRTQRKGELRLEIDLNTSSEKLEQLINGVNTILTIHQVESFSVLMEAITGNAFLVNGDYFTGAITQDEFNKVKQGVNLGVIKLMESLHVQAAGANKELRIISQER